MHVRFAEDRLWHPCKVGEFVDHAPEVPHLADDSLGQAVEGVLVSANVLAEAALQPFGRKLDRGQWIADFMGDAACNVGPGGTPLVGELVRDVIERQHSAVAVAHAVDGQGALAAFRNDRYVGVAAVAEHELGQFGGQARQFAPFHLLLALDGSREKPSSNTCPIVDNIHGLDTEFLVVLICLGAILLWLRKALLINPDHAYAA